MTRLRSRQWIACWLLLSQSCCSIAAVGVDDGACEAATAMAIEAAP
jgi:hypothetical protein